MRLAGFGLLLLTLSAAYGAEVAGTWRGESTCEAKDTACHDETVVYHFSATAKPEVFLVSADKIVDGKPVNMGTLEFRYENNELKCEYPQGVWLLKVDGAKIEGTLTRSGGTVFRRLILHKDAS
jgi:hypothetical protein